MSQAEDEAIWLQLRDAGFDGETVNGKDKAALISYVSKLEKEKHEYQHQMGVLLQEVRHWNFKIGHLKASADSARERAARGTFFADTPREKALKEFLVIKRECIIDIESILHDRKVYVRKMYKSRPAKVHQDPKFLAKILYIEAKCIKKMVKDLGDMVVQFKERTKSYEAMLAEVLQKREEASRKLDEDDAKLMSARSLGADTPNSSLRSTQDVEVREDELRCPLVPLQNEEEVKNKSSSVISPLANGADDEAIWRQLRDAGFDGETVKRKDKEALISYISKLEKEKYEYQHQVGVLFLEAKDWKLKFEQSKASADSAREKAKHDTFFAAFTPTEKVLKEVLEIQIECIKKIDKTLSDRRAAWLELKMFYKSRRAEALKPEALMKFLEIEKECMEKIEKHVNDKWAEFELTKMSYKSKQ